MFRQVEYEEPIVFCVDSSVIFVRIVVNRRLKGSFSGVTGVGAGVTVMQKVWRSLQAFGNIAFAYGFVIILLEIQASHQS
jgi:hypothetical protein